MSQASKLLLRMAAALLPALAAAPAEPPGVVSMRVLLGITDTAPTRWDGTVKIDAGAVKAIQGIRFGAEDSTDYASSWKVATRAQGQEVLENALLITAVSAPDARWSLHTPRGDFSFTPRDVPWGTPKTFLDGAIQVDRVPPTGQLTTSDDDEDFPAIAQKDDDIWLAYVRFAHSNRSLESFQPMREAPADFGYLARPAGGDRVFAMHYSRAAGTWSAPSAVSAKPGNVERAAVAIDGQKRVWAIWSEERDGNFHLFARMNRGGQWGPELRIASEAGSDLSPVAATDAQGRVWVAWQGYRNSNLEILAAVENGDAFAPEALVSTSPASDWDPAIAAAPNGDIAVSWDTYDKGDYDVYFRRMRRDAEGGVAMDAPVAAAATPLFEAHSSVAFDAGDRLWIAWETATARWGKGFGAYETTGTPLYEDRNVRIKCFDGAKAYTTSSDLLNVMPGTPMSPEHEPRPRPNRNPLQPNPNLAKNRRPGQAPGPRNGPLNSYPRLATDPGGGVYLAFRTLSRPANLRSPLGSVWSERLVYFDGHKWVGPVFLPRTDGLLDARPALVAPAAGRLLAVSAMDHRQSTPQGLGPLSAERINGDLYAADLQLDGAAVPASMPELVALPPDSSAPDPRVKAEADQVALVRGYRIDVGGKQLRILRGEAARFTEYSLDGTRDGSLEDAYRYMIDAAALDWGGCCDIENGAGHEYFWWREQTMTDAYRLGDRFTPLFAFDHAVRYPEGHRVVLFAKRGVRPVPHLPPVAVDAPAGPAPDTQMLYRYLRELGGVSVPLDPTSDLGTDWRDNDAAVEPVVAIYQGDRQSSEKEGGPRAAAPGDAINGFHPEGYVSAALDKGYRLGFVAASDHHSTHIAYTNVLVTAPGRDAILDALKQRHVYASTDNIVADVRVGDHLMGDEFAVNGPPKIAVKLSGSAPFEKVVIVKDGQEVYTAAPGKRDVSFEWTDDKAGAGKTSYYYVRGEQTDGQLVWVSPMWIKRN